MKKRIVLLLVFVLIGVLGYSQDTIGEISFMEELRGTVRMMTKPLVIDSYKDIVFPLSGKMTNQRAIFRSSKKTVLLSIISEYESVSVEVGSIQEIKASENLTSNFMKLDVEKSYEGLGPYRFNCSVVNIKGEKVLIMSVPAFSDLKKIAVVPSYELYFNAENIKNLKAVISKISD
jgi:hypothetical protein